MSEEAIEAAARAAYIAHHKNGPTEEAYDEPDMGRGGFKTEVIVWRAVATAAINAYLAARKEAGFVEVPVEPTRAMIEAAETGSHSEPFDPDITWELMIAARPQNEGE